jgi:protein-tyrosine phosphatase
VPTSITALTVEAEDDSIVVTWDLDGAEEPVVISAGPTAVASEHDVVVRAEPGARSARLQGLGPGRIYVSLGVDGAPPRIAAERRVRFSFPTNFRDLGGYPAEGGHTRWGVLYRADALHRMDAEDLVRYRALGIRSVYDLRGDAERLAHPDPVPSRQLSLISGTPAAVTEARAEVDARRERQDGERVLAELYRGIVDNVPALLGELLGSLAEPDALPAVFHCTGGKDRTGIAAALLLDLLGVPRTVVLDDFELTSRFRLRHHQTESLRTLLSSGMAPEAAAGVLGTPRWAMAEALGHLDDRYGGAEAYLLGPGRLDPSTLAELRRLLVA